VKPLRTENGADPSIRAQRRKPPIRRLCLAGAALLGAWFAGLVWFAGLIPAPGPPDPTKTDVIAVLTGGSGRLEAGLDAMTQGLAGRVFVSGVYQGVEVTELLRLATDQPDRFSCCVALGYSADNTAGNARETADWARQNDARSIRLVTGAYHMPRSLMEFSQAMPEALIVAHPVFPDHVKADWWRWPGTTTLVATEYTKYLLGLLRHGLFGAERTGTGPS
jgi:uncharacterized SAM-binding protein YcdF (DUF218 family)